MEQQQNDVTIESGTRGRLVRQVPMRLKDMSLSGCLVESDHSLRVGSSGTLLVDLWGVPCRYPLRVARVSERPDASHNVRIAGAFTWSARPVAPALMAAVERSESRQTARVLPFDRHRGARRLDSR